MTYTFKAFISMTTLFVIGVMVTAAQIDFRRPSDMKGRVVVQPKPPANEPAQPPVRQAPNAEEKNYAYATSIRVGEAEIGETSATLHFKARSGDAPVVEIGLEAPRRNADGILEFANRLDKVDAVVVPEKNVLSQTNFKADLANLNRTTRYFYIITARGSNGTGTLQTQGRFATEDLSVSVTVVYTEIKVTNDSDDGGNGELFFRFYADFPKRDWRAYGSYQKPLSWGDRESRQINEVIEINDAPDALALVVNGYDDDSVLGGGTGLEPSELEPLNSPIDRTDLEANVAKQTFNLRDFPGKYHRQEFELNSMSHGAGQGDLSFVVKGYFEIKRERAN